MYESETKKLELRSLRSDVLVRFKLLSKTIQDPSFSEVYEGQCNLISAEGILLQSQKAPFLKWITELSSQDILLGLNIVLPAYEEPVKALGSFSWLESKGGNPPKVAVALRFKQIDPKDKDKIFGFTLKSSIGP